MQILGNLRRAAERELSAILVGLYLEGNLLCEQLNTLALGLDLGLLSERERLLGRALLAGPEAVTLEQHQLLAGLKLGENHRRFATRILANVHLATRPAIALQGPARRCYMDLHLASAHCRVLLRIPSPLADLQWVGAAERSVLEGGT